MRRMPLLLISMQWTDHYCSRSYEIFPYMPVLRSSITTGMLLFLSGLHYYQLYVYTCVRQNFCVLVGLWAMTTFMAILTLKLFAFHFR